MQVSIEASEGLNRQIKVVVPAEDYKKAEQAQVRNVSKNKRFPGFRPGHVPQNVVMQSYGDVIHSETINSMINATMFAAVHQAGINNMTNTYPEISKIEDNGSAQDFSYVFSIEVKPEINVSDDLKDVKVTKTVAEIEEADVDRMIETLRKQQGKWIEVAQAEAQQGNRCDIAFEGFIDGEAMEHGKADNYSVVIGDKNMVPGFEDQLVGHKAGDEFEINVTFPENYLTKEIAGKNAVFKTKVNKVFELQLPEVNDDFVKLFGMNSDLASFRDAVRKNMVSNLENNLEAINSQAAIEALVATYGNVELPSRMVKQTVEAIQKQNKNVLKEKAEELANLDVKKSLVFEAVVEKFKIKLDPAQVDAYIERLASAYEDSKEYVEAVKKDQRAYNNIINRCFFVQVANFVFSKAEVEEKKQGFYDVVK